MALGRASDLWACPMIFIIYHSLPSCQTHCLKGKSNLARASGPGIGTIPDDRPEGTVQSFMNTCSMM